MNTITATGIAAQDPEKRFTQTGKTVAWFDLAVYQGKEEKSAYYRVVAWERTAEAVMNQVHKGMRVIVSGRQHVAYWERDGKKGQKAEIVADAVGIDVIQNASSQSFDGMGRQVNEKEIPF